MKFLTIILLSLGCFASNAKTIHLNTSNTINFRTAVDKSSILDVQLKIQELVIKRGFKDYPIYLVLDCPGGSIVAGEQFIQYTKMVKNLHTITIFAASMCSAIAEALPGNRYVTENAIMMFHRAKGQFQGQFEEGEVEQQLKLWKTVVLGMEQRNADRIGISLKKYKENVKDEWWVYGKQNVQEGIADESVNITCSNQLIEQKEISEVLTVFGASRQDRSSCPLF